MNIAVVGSGIIGLSTAWRLAQAGCDVTIFDGNKESTEASWAAAGMLAPHNEAKEAGDLWKLCCKSYSMWPSFIDALNLKQEDLDFHNEGSLEPIFKHDDISELSNKVSLLEKAGAKIVWLDKKEILTLEPSLNPDIEKAVLMQGGQVNPRLVCEYLKKACHHLGVHIHYSKKIMDIHDHTLIFSDNKKQTFDKIVLAAGAWTPFLAKLCGINLKGEPVKGQMICLSQPKNLNLKMFIHSKHAYCVQRKNQGIVIGSTMEYRGFDHEDNQASIEKLASGAREVIPALKESQILESWTGLRPRLESGKPLFSRINDCLSITTGHFRNGILLTPITSELMCDLVLDKPLNFDIESFNKF